MNRSKNSNSFCVSQANVNRLAGKCRDQGRRPAASSSSFFTSELISIVSEIFACVCLYFWLDILAGAAAE